MASRDYEMITYEELDGVAWVTLNRPEQLNTFNRQMQLELRDVWRSLRANDAIGVTVLTGAGDRAFCSGFDRKEGKVGPEDPD